MTKWAVESFNPFLTASGRAVIAAIPAILLLRIFRVPLFQRKHLRAYIYTTMGAAFGWPILVALALTRTTSTQTAVVASIMPLVTAMIAVTRKHERVSKLFWIASAAGTIILLLFTISRGGGAKHDLLADLFVLIAVLFSAWTYVEGAELTRIYPGWQVISWVVVLALPINLPLTIFIWIKTSHTHHITTHGLIGIFVIGLSSMYLGFFAWYKGLADAGTARGSQIQQLQGLLTLGWSVLLLKEHVSLGTLLSAIGVVLTVLWALSTRTKQSI